MAEEKEKKEKKDKGNKPGFLKHVSRSLRDMRGEIKKVVWPTKKQVLNNTGIVLVVVAVAGVAVGAFDFLLKFAVDLLLRSV